VNDGEHDIRGRARVRRWYAKTIDVPRFWLVGVLLGACSPAAAVAPQETPRALPPPVAAASVPVTEQHQPESPPPTPPPAPAPRSPFAYANIDPSDDYVVGPPDLRATCDDDLKAASIKYQAATLKVHKEGKNKFECGAPQVVTYKGSPAKITWSPSVLVTCTMALAIARLETIVSEEAQRIYGKKVVKIVHVGTYSCREMAAYKGWVSEHSYANAIDLSEFFLEDGKRISVLDHFAPKLATPKTKESEFLRAIAKRMFEEETFSTVLTPFFDALHANHFHIDLARFRTDGTKAYE
jgi:hypothetical protein